jgi:hypothetical protein
LIRSANRLRIAAKLSRAVVNAAVFLKASDRWWLSTHRLIHRLVRGAACAESGNF